MWVVVLASSRVTHTGRVAKRGWVGHKEEAPRPREQLNSVARSFSHSTNRSLSAFMGQVLWQVLGDTSQRINEDLCRGVEKIK